MEKKFCAYFRVSTARQGESHLGIEAQMKMCNDFAKQNGGTIITTFQDYESGKSRTREGLWSAIDFCKQNNCPLVIAKLDRLARDVEFTFKIMNTGVQIHFCDMPVVNTMILGVFASVAQYERELISARTRAALQAKKARGEVWSGNRCMNRARVQSAINRRKKAQENEHNQRVWRYLESWERRNAKITNDTPRDIFIDLANILNELGYTTPTGLPFNELRLRAMWAKLTNLYND
jgi:DNA invertase Pin-like site-specific DNA recombinase